MPMDIKAVFEMRAIKRSYLRLSWAISTSGAKGFVVLPPPIAALLLNSVVGQFVVGTAESAVVGDPHTGRASPAAAGPC